MTAAILTVFILAAPAPKDTAGGADWPQWRGPNRDGKSAEKGIVFPKEGAKLAWQNDNVGTGYGQPAVVGNRVYIVGGSANAAGSPESLYCLNLADGKEIWAKELGTSAGEFLDRWGGGPRSTPTVHDGHVYVLGGTGDLVCFTADDGKKVWSKNLGKDFGGGIPQWGYAESPLVDDGRVIVTPGKATGMAALDAKTGETAWKCTEFKDGAGYSSIVIMKVGEKKLYVQQTMRSAVGVWAKDGKLGFKAGEIKRSTAVIPTPVVAGDYVYYTAGYRAGCECYQVTADGDGVKAKLLFTDASMSNHHGGVINLDDRIFGHSDTSSGWVNMTFKTDKPEVVWNSTNLGKGSVSYADDHLFCYAERNGELAVLKANPKEWDEVGRMKLPRTSQTRPKAGMVWPHPTIAQGKLFLRDFELLFAFDVKK